MKLIDIIKFDGKNDLMVWKYPKEDFNTFSQLVVNESQEALLFLNGQALDLFPSGKYTMHTGNIPLLNKIVNLPSDGESPFHCAVYFINKSEQMAIPWGAGDVNYADPTNNNHNFRIGMNGEMSVRVADSRKLILKLVGTGNEFTQEQLKRYFKAPIISHIKSTLPKILRERNCSIFDVENDLIELSGILKERVSAEMSDYGITLEKLWIYGIMKPESDPVYITLNGQRGQKVINDNQAGLDQDQARYQEQILNFKHANELQRQAQEIDLEKMKMFELGKTEIDLKAYEKDKLGVDYQMKMRQFDVMDKVATNEGTGADLRNLAMGVGVGFGVGGAFGNAFADIASNTMETSNLNGFGQNRQSEEKYFGDTPGMLDLKEEMVSVPEEPVPEQKQDSGQDFNDRINRLLLMKEKGLISEEEFNSLKKQLIEEIFKL